MKVLVVGGAGYIGAHICKALAARGDTPVVFDNLSRGHTHAVRWGPLEQGDIRQEIDLRRAFEAHQPDAVMHFAAFAEVAEGEADPLGFWDNNVAGSLNLLRVMADAGWPPLVFSSTCAVYGVPERLPLTEDTLQRPINVYGRTKQAVERALADQAGAGGLRYAALRYFNAAGASPDGEIGEEHEPETHLIPNALKAAAGVGPAMKLFGTDYDTPDGTCIRDFIHVADLAQAHLAALDRLQAGAPSFTCNLGSGQGYSVREVLDAVERVTGRAVPFSVESRRPGDPARLFADISRAQQLLGFAPERSGLETMIADAWAFHRARWNLPAQ
ncbi:UDP-glucose 4-epimerase GalE [Maricaulis sp.]|uniref:UDP-glucose 4-epimerase GalE n=1 Tax=Maricaulis sp. TaxID=1486257 RepID=UPI002619644A|nr:UDP-glucose 4-epimerase GalE [Maricaulis sp.]